jgi:hypothetical protein
MNETKIKVPDEMLKVAYEKRLRTFCANGEQKIKVALEAALRWQKNNAPPPSAEFVAEFMMLGWSVPPLALHDFGCQYARCMYDAPEPEESEEIADLLEKFEVARMVVSYGSARQIAIEAFRLGRWSK